MSTTDPTSIHAKEREKREKRREERYKKTLEADDFRWLMSDPRGRRLVWDILDRAGIYRTSFTGNSETFFREGERNMGIMIVSAIHDYCPERYNQMVTENTCHKKTN